MNRTHTARPNRTQHLLDMAQSDRAAHAILTTNLIRDRLPLPSRSGRPILTPIYKA